MKAFVVVASLLAVASASTTILAAPRWYGYAPAATYYAAPAELSSQYHAQDSLGQYSYGYNGGLSAKAETKSFDGVTRGSYSYLDAENKLQTVSYTADALNGFRAQASNLPQAPVETRVAPAPVQDTPEVAKARADHLVAVEEAKVRNANAASSDESAIIVSAAPAAVAPIAPIVPQIATYAAPIALAPASGFAYSHSTVNLKPEVYAAAPAPVATIAAAPASFAYQTYSAAAPALYNTWSQAPAYAYSYGAPAFYAANTAAVPLPVQDTPEVMQAKAEHFAAVAEAKARNLQLRYGSITSTWPTDLLQVAGLGLSDSSEVFGLSLHDFRGVLNGQGNGSGVGGVESRSTVAVSVSWGLAPGVVEGRGSSGVGLVSERGRSGSNGGDWSWGGGVHFRLQVNGRVRVGKSGSWGQSNWGGIGGDLGDNWRNWGNGSWGSTHNDSALIAGSGVGVAHLSFLNSDQMVSTGLGDFGGVLNWGGSHTSLDRSLGQVAGLGAESVEGISGVRDSLQLVLGVQVAVRSAGHSVERLVIMKVFIVVSSLLAVAFAAPQLLTQRVYAAVPAVTTYVAAPAEVSSQFHAQDGLGQYTYGYNGGLSAKTEAKSLDGVTRGAYHYLDAENKLQTVTYTADAVNGFRAEASNMPVAPVETRVAPEPVQDTPEVMQAKAEHMSAVEDAKVRLAAAEKEETAEIVESAEPAPIPAIPAIAPITTYSAVAAPIALAPASGFAYQTSSVALKNEPLAYTTYTAAPVPAAAVEIKTPASFSYSTYSQSAPATAIQYAAAPFVQALPAATTYALNVQAPAYTYSYGAPAFYTTTNQLATPVTFAARALPAPVPAGAETAAEVVETAALPEPVQDTPEVAQAKAEFLQTFEQVKARNAQ
ncbi:uncharacterized protein LOC120412572 [Culex pipiens pallens]|uniref:uncharacterized protein LOC120412572 n=2 Tax=Culex pipiens pallens TaxID=42434 RepID=UPI0022AA739E|nr:uncharacterized protein LOC120412572 [Culex pipiens pallens]